MWEPGKQDHSPTGSVPRLTAQPHHWQRTGIMCSVLSAVNFGLCCNHPTCGERAEGCGSGESPGQCWSQALTESRSPDSSERNSFHPNSMTQNTQTSSNPLSKVIHALATLSKLPQGFMVRFALRQWSKICLQTMRNLKFCINSELQPQVESIFAGGFTFATLEKN